MAEGAKSGGTNKSIQLSVSHIRSDWFKLDSLAKTRSKELLIFEIQNDSACNDFNKHVVMRENSERILFFVVVFFKAAHVFTYFYF